MSEHRHRIKELEETVEKLKEKLTCAEKEVQRLRLKLVITALPSSQSPQSHFYEKYPVEGFGKRVLMQWKSADVDVTRSGAPTNVPSASTNSPSVSTNAPSGKIAGLFCYFVWFVHFAHARACVYRILSRVHVKSSTPSTPSPSSSPPPRRC